jgi:hypothetical protein
MSTCRHITFLLLLLFCSNNASAAEMNDSQKAMQVAENTTQGKAIGAKFIQKGKLKGYKVRIMKDGKISHVFVSLQQLQ